MSMDTNELIWALAIAALLGGGLAYIFWRERQKVRKGIKDDPGQRTAASYPLQLQAYERLILLSERISLPNIINRVNQPGLTSKDMQLLLIQTIRQEFEHNITQQIYVTPEAWDAVKNLKEQNIHIINQVASFLPPESSGTELSKYVLEMLVQNPKASLHGIVSEVLSYEAKKLMA
ncbi:MAG TPA: hypothetical protein VM012_13300 [Flavitalea sp.]|nr:hypothetical protein [Flavitalea sp.]